MIVLVNPPTSKKILRDMAGGLGFGDREGFYLPPLDLMYLAAVLRPRHEVFILDCDATGMSQDDAIACLRGHEPELAIVNVSLPCLDEDLAFIKMLVCRGLRVYAKTSIPYPDVLTRLLEQTGAELALTGEVEHLALDVVEGRTLRGTARLQDGQLFAEPADRLDHLDDLPYPARDLVDHAPYSYRGLGNGLTTMVTGRGCPHTCSYYCPYPLVQGKHVRLRSAANVLGELADAVGRHGISKVLFRDVIFTLDQRRTYDICQGIREAGWDLSWWCETRVDCLTPDLLESMRRAGCRGINLGVEVGDEELRLRRVKKGLSAGKLGAVRQAAEEVGIELRFLVMIGFPEESRGSIWKTYQMLRDLDIKRVGISILTPYPGTQLFEDATRQGWVETLDWSLYDGRKAVMHTPRLSRQELAWARDAILTCNSLRAMDGLTLGDRVRLRTQEARLRRWSEATSPARPP